MDLNALAGAWPYACLALLLVYPVANRTWGADPVRIRGRKIGSHSAAGLLLVLLGVPLGFVSAGLGGLLIPVLFVLWRAIVIGGDWATPDTPKEVTLALLRHMIPAGIVAAIIGICTVNRWPQVYDLTLVVGLAAFALGATIAAVEYARVEGELANDLAAGRITQGQCDAAIGEANRVVEFVQGLCFGLAVTAWTLLS